MAFGEVPNTVNRMIHLPWHDIGRVALNPRRDVRSLLLERLRPGGSFMSYESIKTCLACFLRGELSLDRAKRWLSAIHVPKNVHQGLIELLELLADWVKGRNGFFIPFENRPLPIAAGETSRVHLSGLWKRSDDPAIYWFFLRRVEALLGPDEIAFSMFGIREVLEEPEFRELPIVVVDCSAGAAGAKRRIKEYRSTDVREFSAQEVNAVVNRYLRARYDAEPVLATLRAKSKRKPDRDDQPDMFE